MQIDILSISRVANKSGVQTIYKSRCIGVEINITVVLLKWKNEVFDRFDRCPGFGHGRKIAVYV